MIYDDIKAWAEYINSWSSIIGYKSYTSYSLSKQNFKNDPLLPHFLNIIVFMNSGSKENKKFETWFNYEYKDRPKLLDSYLELSKNGYLFDIQKDVFYTKFMSLGSQFTGLRHVEYPCIVEEHGSLCITAVKVPLLGHNRLQSRIEYIMDLNGSVEILEPVALTPQRLAGCLYSVTDKPSALLVLSLFLEHKFELPFLKESLSYIQPNMWFSEVLQRPLEDVISEILGYQLDMPLEKVSIFVNLIGTDDMCSLVNTLIQQRDTVFDPATEIDYDIIF